MTNLKLAFIGFGKHAQNNLYPSLKSLGYKLVSVSTLHEETSQLAAQEYAIPTHFTDHTKMMSVIKPDAVFICCKPEIQADIVKSVLNSGAHVFVEKPLGMNLSQAVEIAELSRKTGKHVMVGFMKRFAPAFSKIKKVLDSGEIGQPLSITQNFACRNFAHDTREYLLFAGIHFVDLLRWYLGEVESCSGNELAHDGSISISYTLKFKSGAIGSLHFCGTPAWERGLAEMTITGTKGYVKVSGIDEVKVYKNTESVLIPRWQIIEEKEVAYDTMLTTSGGWKQPLYLNGFIGEIKHFVETIEACEKPDNSAEDNAATMKLVDQLVESIADK